MRSCGCRERGEPPDGQSNRLPGKACRVACHSTLARPPAVFVELQQFREWLLFVLPELHRWVLEIFLWDNVDPCDAPDSRIRSKQLNRREGRRPLSGGRENSNLASEVYLLILLPHIYP